MVRSSVGKMSKRAVYLYGYAKGKNLPLFMKSITVMVKKFKGQKRRDRTRASDHGLDVSALALCLGIDKWLKNIRKLDVALATYVLHDIKEDTKTTDEEIEREFGKEVLHKVDLFTRKPGESKKQYMLRVSSDIVVLFGKGCDRLLNMKGIKTFKLEGKIEYLDEVVKIIMPHLKKARRLNLEYSDALVAIRDMLNIIRDPWEENISLTKENIALKKKMEKMEKFNKA